MRLPTPFDVLKNVWQTVREAFFVFLMLLLFVPLVQWGFVVLGVVLVLPGHWIVGGVLIAAGLLGIKLGKDIEI